MNTPCADLGIALAAERAVGADARPTALIQYNCIPHYRKPIFELLSACAEARFTVVADDAPDTPFLRTVRQADCPGIRRAMAATRIIRLPGLPALYWQPRALRLAWRERPDVIIALGSPYSLTAWALCLLGRALDIPVLLWGHGLQGDESGPKWWLRKAFYRLAAGQVLYGEHAKDLLVRRGFDPRRLHVVYNSLDYDRQAAIDALLDDEIVQAWRRAQGIGAGEGMVVFTGRLQAAKRLDLLLDALGRLAKRGRRVHAALVGEGDQQAALARQAAALGIADRVHFLGASYDEHFIGMVLKAADVCVVPDAAGLSVMHALVFGTPVILHDRTEFHCPEWEAVQERVTGFFYRYGDVDDLASMIGAAIYPETRKTRMAAACRRVIRERYNPHRQVEFFLHAVRSAVAGRAGGPC